MSCWDGCNVPRTPHILGMKYTRRSHGGTLSLRELELRMASSRDGVAAIWFRNLEEGKWGNPIHNWLLVNLFIQSHHKDDWYHQLWIGFQLSWQNDDESWWNILFGEEHQWRIKRSPLDSNHRQLMLNTSQLPTLDDSGDITQMVLYNITITIRSE